MRVNINSEEVIEACSYFELLSKLHRKSACIDESFANIIFETDEFTTSGMRKVVNVNKLALNKTAALRSTFMSEFKYILVR